MKAFEQSSELNRWLQYIQSIHFKTIDFTLDRVLLLAEKFNLIQFNSKVITVTGTNGKGTTVAVLERFLHSLNYKVGVFTSPHLIYFNERIRVNTFPVNENIICEALREVEENRCKISLTYFEFITLAALIIFKKMQLDFIILEVGMGGRLDAVNVVESNIGIVTSVGLDHQFYLGPDREAIGLEKSFIFRKEKPAICGDENPPVSLIQNSLEIQAKLNLIGREFGYITSSNSWSWFRGNKIIGDLNIPFSLELSNISCALMALHLLELDLAISTKNINENLQKIRFLGRFTYLNGRNPVILDVGHNSHAANRIVKRITEMQLKGKLVIIFAMNKDKDIEETIQFLKEIVDEWWIILIESDPRIAMGERYLNSLSDLGKNKVNFYKSLKEVYEDKLFTLPNQDTVLVFGSFRIVFEFLKLSFLQLQKDSPNFPKLNTEFKEN